MYVSAFLLCWTAWAKVIFLPQTNILFKFQVITLLPSAYLYDYGWIFGNVPWLDVGRYSRAFSYLFCFTKLCTSYNENRPLKRCAFHRRYLRWVTLFTTMAHVLVMTWNRYDMLTDPLNKALVRIWTFLRVFDINRSHHIMHGVNEWLTWQTDMMNNWHEWLILMTD